MKRFVILISGRGSNMDALLDAKLPGECAAVISNRPGAAGLTIAAARGINTLIVDHTNFASREAFDAELARQIDSFSPDLVLLAGFMRILTPAFVTHYAGRLLNIHPSLLPSFPGVRTHEQALAAGVRIHGCSIHFVTPALDGGPIVAQTAVPVLADDDAAALGARVLCAEHRLYPEVARCFLDGRLTLDGAGRVCLAGDTSPASALQVPAL